MSKLSLLILALLMANGSFADPLDGLAIFDLLIYIILIGAVGFIVLTISAVLRFTRKEHQVSAPLNFCATALIICALIAIGDLGSGIDPGFLAFCIGSIILSILLIFLNFRVGSNRNQ